MEYFKEMVNTELSGNIFPVSLHLFWLVRNFWSNVCLTAVHWDLILHYCMC